MLINAATADATPNVAAPIDMRANRVVVALISYLLSGAIWSGEGSTIETAVTVRLGLLHE
ncbi:hypothetical protein MTY66_30470 [Mycolicibacterium sp. TY66]|nr:hypothetical protein MTY66_30470 [Mycolicibacterium sp. TY66]BCJ80916.1 hypothetical protein MTY81_22890 [Mycolicibacterium sp. TY81]